MKHHDAAKKGHGHHHPPSTTTWGNLKHTYSHMWKETGGFKPSGFFGFQFLVEAVLNPFFLPRALLSARHSAKSNKKLMEMRKKYGHATPLHSAFEGITKDRALGEFFIKAANNDMISPMRRRLERLEKLKFGESEKSADKPEALKEYKIEKRLSPPEIEEYLSILEERNEILADLMELKGLYANLGHENNAAKYEEGVKNCVKRLEEFQRLIHSKKGELAMHGLAETTAMYQLANK